MQGSVADPLLYYKFSTSLILLYPNFSVTSSQDEEALAKALGMSVGVGDEKDESLTETETQTEEETSLYQYQIVRIPISEAPAIHECPLCKGT
jgi:hypothetical protein